MIYCRTCGQCSHISRDHFHASISVYSYQDVSVDPETEDISEYGDIGDWDSSGDGPDNYTCPYCDGSNIQFGTHISTEQAFQRRHAYEEEMRISRENYEKEEKLAKLKRKSRDPNREWDVKENV
jgi:hypothetical protein